MGDSRHPPVWSPAYDQLLVEQCAVIAPVLNWNLISPEPGAFRDGTDLGVVAFARAHGLRLTGMHLLWYEAIPKWFASISDRASAFKAMEAHITRMGAAYSDATWSVNVVNEALDPASGRNDDLRRDPFSDKFGRAYLDHAFRTAREAFPHALLLYNENFLEQDWGDLKKKRAAVLNIVDWLRSTDTPIDGIGLQSHLTLSKRFDSDSYTEFLNQISDRGLRIVVTELDVSDLEQPGGIEARDRAVADMYLRYVTAVLNNTNTVGVVTWGLSDRETWITPAFSPRLKRADGLPARPLPFDSELRPKPAYYAMLEAFRGAPPRRSG